MTKTIDPPFCCANCPVHHQTVFSDIAQKDLSLIDRYKMVNRYKKKQIVFYEGNATLGLYFVRTGKVKLYKSSAEGKQQILRIAKAGDALGCTSCFAKTVHNMTAEALEDSEICFLDKNIFFTVLNSNPSVAAALLTGVSQQLIETESKVLDLAYKSARVRFAELLLMLQKSFSIKGSGIHRLDIELSREEMAQAVGTTMETAVRLLSEFEDDGFIEVDRRSIAILDSEALLEITKSGY